MTKYGFEACEIIWKFLNHPTDVCHVQLKRTKTGKHGCFSKLLVFTIIPLENLLSKCTNIFQSKSAVINQRTDNFWSSSKPSKKSTKGKKKIVNKISDWRVWRHPWEPSMRVVALYHKVFFDGTFFRTLSLSSAITPRHCVYRAELCVW